MVLTKYLIDMLPDDIHERCTGKCYVSWLACFAAVLFWCPCQGQGALSAVAAYVRWWSQVMLQVSVTRAFPRPKNMLISEYDSKVRTSASVFK